MTNRMRLTVRRIVRALAWRATNCQPIAAEVTVLCCCGETVCLINLNTGLHGQCSVCRRYYSGAFYVRSSEEPLPWQKKEGLG